MQANLKQPPGILRFPQALQYSIDAVDMLAFVGHAGHDEGQRGGVAGTSKSVTHCHRQEYIMIYGILTVVIME